MKTAFMIITAAFCFIVPICLAIIWKKKSDCGIWPFAVGAICFIVFARILETILHYFFIISDNPVSQAIKASPILFTVYGSLAAGIFEETGRLFGYKVLLSKNNDIETSVAYGIGHGGIEAILLLGVTYVLYIIASLGISVGDAATDLSLQEIIAGITPEYCLLAMWERSSAIILHIALSIFMFIAAKEQGKLWLYPMSIFIHALADVPAALYQFGVIKSLVLIELYIFIYCLITLIPAIILYRNRSNSPLQA